MNRCKKCKKFCKTLYCSDKCNPNSTDEFTPFKKHIKAARYRAKKKKIKINISVADLKYLWEKQNGICVYTGWKLINYSEEKRTGDREKFASVDRIDSSKGYIRGNVQFVSYIAQIAKGDFSESVFIEFCKAISKKVKND